MEKHLWQKANNAKWVIGGFVGTCFLFQKLIGQPAIVNSEVFGMDGNGGRMLRIVTNLTDEEVAKLKFVRRMNWHWRGRRKGDFGTEPI